MQALKSENDKCVSPPRKRFSASSMNSTPLLSLPSPPMPLNLHHKRNNNQNQHEALHSASRVQFAFCSHWLHHIFTCCFLKSSDESSPIHTKFFYMANSEDPNPMLGNIYEAVEAAPVYSETPAASCTASRCSATASCSSSASSSSSSLHDCLCTGGRCTTVNFNLRQCVSSCNKKFTTRRPTKATTPPKCAAQQPSKRKPYVILEKRCCAARNYMYMYAVPRNISLLVSIGDTQYASSPSLTNSLSPTLLSSCRCNMLSVPSSVSRYYDSDIRSYDDGIYGGNAHGNDGDGNEIQHEKRNKRKLHGLKHALCGCFTCGKRIKRSGDRQSKHV